MTEVRTRSSSEMSAETLDHVNALMLQFRELVIELHEDQNKLRDKLRELPPIRPPRRNNTLRRMLTNKQNSDTSTTTATIETNSSSNLRPPSYSQVSTVMRGSLIVLEGLDRVGKSTLAKKLTEHLAKTKKPVEYVRFPDRKTKVGQLIDECLRSSSKKMDDHVLHLLFSANRWELAKRIRNSLNQGTTVVVDRYSYSGIAYSSAKNLNFDWCREMERGLPQPDLVIYLELPKEDQYQRQGFGEEQFETKEMQELVRVQYERVIESSREKWLRINVANKPPDQVLGEVLMPVKKCLETSATRELGSL